MLRRLAVAVLATTGAVTLTGATGAALDLQGHRGARGLLPENTLPAFTRAIEAGMTTLELDAGVTRDGVVVVAHDRRMNADITRGPDGAWLSEPTPAIHELTFEQLLGYDVGRIRPDSRYARSFPDQQPVDGTRMPPLLAVLELGNAAGRPLRYNIETKLSPEKPDETPPPEAFADAVLSVLRQQDALGQATIQSFDWRTLQHVQKVAPEVATVYLTAEQSWTDNIRRGQPGPSPWTAGFDIDEHGSLPKLVKAAGGAVWSPFFRELTPEALAEAHGLGLKVVTWTVNDEADIRRLVDMGVDGIISDYPDRLARVALGR